MNSANGIVLVPRPNQTYLEPNQDFRQSSQPPETRLEDLDVPPRNDGLEVPSEKTFYGLINDCIEDTVVEGFGRDKWHEVKRRAGVEDVEDGDFIISQKYSADLTYRILGAITEVLELTTEQALEAAGESFINSWCVKHNYVDLLRSQGKNMRELLGNMDKMHAYLNQAKLPGMNPPCFKVEDSSDGRGFILHYWSFRPGLAPLAKGIVQAVGQMLFKEMYTVEVLGSGEDDGNHYTKFRVTTACDASKRSPPKDECPWKSGASTPLMSIPADLKCPFSGMPISPELLQGSQPDRRKREESPVAHMPPRNDGLEVPSEKTFYGLINDCIEDTVVEGFGRDKWHEVKRRAGVEDVEDGDFIISQKYSADLTYRILGAITEVLELTTEQALEAAGESFINSWCVKHNYVDLLRSQGKNMRELLGNMDKMHAYLNQVKLPGMNPPCFKVEDSSDGRGFILHYWSFRPGLAPLAKGIVRAVGKMLFFQDLQVDVVGSKEEDGHHYTKFRVSSSMDDEDWLAAMQQDADGAQLAGKSLGPAIGANVLGCPPMMVVPKESAGGLGDSGGGSPASAAPGKDLSSNRKRSSLLFNLFKPVTSSDGTSIYRLRRNKSVSSESDCSTSVSRGALSPNGRKSSLAGGNEVGALVFMLKDSVSKLSSAQDVEAFQDGFTVDQLCPLLELKGKDAVDALRALFREPITTALRVPHSGYPPSNFAVYEYPGVVMQRSVTARLTQHGGKKVVDYMHPPLADQLPREGLYGIGTQKEMKQIHIRACFLRNVVQLRVLKSIALNQNASLFESQECQAIILAAWQKVRHRYLVDLLFEVALIGVLTQWQRSEGKFSVGFPLIGVAIAKEVAEEFWGLCIHVQRGWLWQYLTPARLGTWGRVLPMALFFVMSWLEEPLASQRAVFAVVVLLRWARLLYMFRAFDSFGPKLLPIIYMFKSMGPFFVVLIFYIGAFSHSLWALSDKTRGEALTLTYRLGILMDFTLDSQYGDFALIEGDEMDGWQMGWFYACSILLTLFMMNVVIGVLGESYDTEQERAAYSFLLSRAQICYEYIPRLKRSPTPLKLYNYIRAINHRAQESQAQSMLWFLLFLPGSFLYAVQRAFVCEWRVFDHHGDDSKDHHAPYLWFCTVDAEFHEDANQSRTARLKRHAEKTSEEMRGRMDKLEAKVDKCFDKMMKSMTELSKKLHSSSDPQTVSGTLPSAPRKSNSLQPRTDGTDTGRCPGRSDPTTIPPRNDRLDPPLERTFYGLINDCIEDTVVEGFGRDKWHEVKRRAGVEDVEDGDFIISQKYSADLTYRILGAITEVLELTTEQALEAAGESFINSWCVKHNYVDLLRSQGKNMRELLGNMDKMHAYLNQAKLPGMNPPCFKVEDSSDGRGFILHYWSFRPGLAPLAKGIVQAVGQMLFKEMYTVEVLGSGEDDGNHYTKFQVSVADGSDFVPLTSGQSTTSPIVIPAGLKCPFSGMALPSEMLNAAGANQIGPAEPSEPELVDMPPRNDGLEVPSEKTFYGLINDCIEDTVVEGFGRDKWHEVKRRAGVEDVEDGDFIISQKYSADLTYRILGAITEVLELTTEQALEAAGESFINSWCVKHNYVDLLRSQGKNMRELLGNMDKMHAYLNQAKLPGMNPPCFKVEDSSDGRGFILHYWSFRPGLAPLAKGIVQAVGRMLFGEEYVVFTLGSKEEDGHHYTKFHVTTEWEV